MVNPWVLIYISRFARFILLHLIYFYEERKGGENFRKKTKQKNKNKKNKFRYKVIKGLHKLKNSVWFVHRTHTNVIIYITIA